MPSSSARRRARAARRIWPPGWSAASNSTTAWPRAAATLAASRPAGPAPTTTTFFLRPVGAADLVGHGGLAAGRRVVDAERLVALVDPVEAVGRADAGPDLVLAAGGDLARDVRVGDVGAGHADHVELARGDRVARGRDVVDAGGMEYRDAERRLDLAGEVEMRRGRHAVDRDHLGQRRIGLDVAADHVEEVDLAACHQAAADLEPFGARQALLPGLVGDHAEADDELRRRPRPGSPRAPRR